MALYWNLDDVGVDDLSGNNIEASDQVAAKGHDMRLVHGNECALAISRQGGYHSSPHIHDYEQLNFIQAGEMWFCVHDQGFHLTAGDFLRIPRNAIHWSWVQTEQPCLCHEVVSPVPPDKKGRPDRKRGLFSDDEQPVPRPRSGSTSSISRSTAWTDRRSRRNRRSTGCRSRAESVGSPGLGLGHVVGTGKSSYSTCQPQMTPIRACGGASVLESRRISPVVR